jgi:nitroreductase
MALMDIVKQRKSVRRYLEKPIPREHIIRCIEAARLSPTADNLRPWRFIVLDDRELIRRLTAAVCTGICRRTRFIGSAAAIVVILADLNFAVHRLGAAIFGTQHYLLDIGIAGEHVVLQAQELGIGTCWINLFNARAARKALEIPKKYRVVSFIAMGYPAEGATRDRPDHPLEKILFFNKEYQDRSEF